jgi:hypothetical protein
MTDYKLKGMRLRRNEGKSAQETSMLVLLLKGKLRREVGFCFGGKKPLRINIRTKSAIGMFLPIQALHCMGTELDLA